MLFINVHIRNKLRVLCDNDFKKNISSNLKEVK